LQWIFLFEWSHTSTTAGLLCIAGTIALAWLYPRIRAHQQTWVRSIVAVLLLPCVIYTEWFNGVQHFRDYETFAMLRNDLKAVYPEVPILIKPIPSDRRNTSLGH
jgi:hypothetical protein